MTLLQLSSTAELRSQRATWHKQVKKLGLVPTMGNLHAGHLSLVRAAKAECDVVMATIFVNPMQFGPNEDLARYPRTLTEDLAALHSEGCDAVFTPTVETMYPAGSQYQATVTIPHLSTLYCGKSRPGHFDGVCTIVSKLFNLTQPDTAYFGLKDFQQFFLIRKMTADLQIPVRLVGLPTMREPSGLAMSSRNGYLSQHQRHQAAGLYALLRSTAEVIQGGSRDYAMLSAAARAQLQSLGFRPDYFEVVNQRTLLPAASSDLSLVLLVAAYLGETRLIDNLTLDLTAGLP